MLAPAQQLITHAQENRYILPTFSTSNLEVTQAIVRAAVIKKAPIEIQASENTVAYVGLQTMVAMVKAMSEENREVPIALHLDHGRHYKTVSRAVKAGFSSVMFDGSELPFEENVKMTKKVVEYAHDFGILCQGELGGIPKAKLLEKGEIAQKDIVFTDPEQAQLFINLTGVDTLAVSVGNAHGVFKDGQPKIDFDRLRAIYEKIRIPLVIHGGSGIKDEDVRRMVDFGVVKVNINTEIYLAFTKAIRKLLATDQKVMDPRSILAVGRAAAQVVIQEKIDVFGAGGQAQVNM